MQILTDSSFLKYLVEYDRDSIPEMTLRALSRVVEDPAFTPDAVGRQSTAARSLCLWVRAMFAYGQIALVVAPKRARLQEAEFSVSTMTAQLNAKQQQLRVRFIPLLFAARAHDIAYVQPLTC